MASFLLREVLSATGGTVLGPTSELEFAGVSTDTRGNVEGRLFVALEGPHFDGHRFLAEAARKGARGALVSRVIPPDEVPLVQVRVEDTRRALGELGRFHARRSHARRVGVTGSNGKTTTKNLIQTALSAGGSSVASFGSYNNEIGVPLTLLEIEPHTDFATIELGSSGPGEIRRLARLVTPEVGVITNCSYAHVERLGDLNGVVEEKGSLLSELPADGIAILNADDPSFAQLRERAACPVVTFGVRRPADFRATNIRFDLTRLAYQLDRERVFVPLGGCHNVYNSLAAVAVATVMGVQRADAIRALRHAEGPPMRLRPVTTETVTILDDTYNANPGSVEAAFRTLAAVGGESRKVVVLGDMKELGRHAPSLHREAGRWVSLLDLGLLVAVGKHAEEVRAGALEKSYPDSRIVTFADASAAAAAIPRLVQPGDTVLVKGSRAMAMETVVSALQNGRAARAG